MSVSVSPTTTFPTSRDPYAALAAVQLDLNEEQAQAYVVFRIGDRALLRAGVAHAVVYAHFQAELEGHRLPDQFELDAAGWLRVEQCDDGFSIRVSQKSSSSLDVFNPPLACDTLSACYGPERVRMDPALKHS